jgi:hypothetical protein
MTKRGALGGSFLASGEKKGGVVGLAWRNVERGSGRAPVRCWAAVAWRRYQRWQRLLVAEAG